jgi:hypothetical protein
MAYKRSTAPSRWSNEVHASKRSNDTLIQRYCSPLVRGLAKRNRAVRLLSFPGEKAEFEKGFLDAFTDAQVHLYAVERDKKVFAAMQTHLRKLAAQPNCVIRDVVNSTFGKYAEQTEEQPDIMYLDYMSNLCRPVTSDLELAGNMLLPDSLLFVTLSLCYGGDYVKRIVRQNLVEPPANIIDDNRYTRPKELTTQIRQKVGSMAAYMNSAVQKSGQPIQLRPDVVRIYQRKGDPKKRGSAGQAMALFGFSVDAK